MIPDGLDVHGLGQNEDVLKIVSCEKLLDCGIVVFSRPPNTMNVAKYSHTIVSVSEFAESEAEKFV